GQGIVDHVGRGVLRVEPEPVVRLAAWSVPVVVLLAEPAPAKHERMRALLPVQVVDRIEQWIKGGDGPAWIRVAVKAGQTPGHSGVLPGLAVQIRQVDAEILDVEDRELVEVARVELVNQCGASGPIHTEPRDAIVALVGDIIQGIDAARKLRGISQMIVSLGLPVRGEEAQRLAVVPIGTDGWVVGRSLGWNLEI